MFQCLAGKLDDHGYLDGSCTDARFFYPKGITESLNGSILYVCEWWNRKGEGKNVIRSINLKSCKVKTVAGSYDTINFIDGPGRRALFYQMNYLATHSVTGDIYISDSSNNAIRFFSPINEIVLTLAGKATAGYKDCRISNVLFYFPTGIVINRKGTVYISDRDDHGVQTILSDGIVSTLAGGNVPGFYDGLKKDAQLRSLFGLCLDKDQFVLYVADGENSAVRIVGAQSGNTGTVAVRKGKGNDDGFGAFVSFSYPTFITADASGNIYVSDHYNNKI
jgi:hypothetical protein